MRTDGSDKLMGLFGGSLGSQAQKCLGDLTEDSLQNELILIAHHLDDAEEGMGNDDLDYARASLRDIREVVGRLKKYLSADLAGGVDGGRE